MVLLVSLLLLVVVVRLLLPAMVVLELLLLSAIVTPLLRVARTAPARPATKAAPLLPPLLLPARGALARLRAEMVLLVPLLPSVVVV